MKPAGRRDRGADGVAIALVAGPPPGVAAGDEQIAAQRFAFPVARLEDAERALVVPGRLLEGQICQRLVPGLARVADRLGHVGDLRRGEPVVGQFVDARLRGGARQVFQRLSHPAMQARAARRAQLFVQCGADQCVAEGKAIRRARYLSDQGCRGRFLERVEHGVLGTVGDPRQQRHVELAPDHGRQLQHLVGRFREPAQPPADHFLDALGDAQAGDVAPVGPAIPLPEDRARLAEMAEDLADEERAALGLVMQCTGERDARLWQLVAGGGGQEADHSRFVEAAQRYALYSRLATEIRQG